MSNRRAPAKKDEDAGKVKGDIKSLAGNISTANKRTLGEYLASIDPHAERIRTRYTSRKMYSDEFDAIWTAQQPHHPNLTAEFRKALNHAIFHQRPLKDQSDLIGPCSLLPTEKRAPTYHLDYQRFRILDRVNALRLIEPERPLDAAERAKLVAELTTRESLKYSKAKTLLGLPKFAKFSIEEGGEKELKGNVTNVRMAEALNLTWDEMPPDRQYQLVADWAVCPDDESFRNKLTADWNFTEDQIERLCDVRLPDDYAGFSISSIRRLLPHLDAGLTTGEARKKEFPESFEAEKPLDKLPPVIEVLPEIRNPAVLRVLTELRKCVNSFILRYGKPDLIHVELARDLKRSKKDRQELTKTIRENEAKRDNARQQLIAHGLTQPKGRDIEKYRLWQECAEICPYSGRSISFDALFGTHPQFDIEHIIPESRSFDSSFNNKTLCLRDFNARKRNHTPFEAFHADPDWDNMVERVRKFGNRGKLKRFAMTETDTAALLEQFTTNQLNDTRYATKLAARYLGKLYGGRDDAGGTRRINACAGGVTAILRRLWHLNEILSDSPEKTREDHRHHAIDAATVALASQRMIQLLSSETIRAELAGQRRLKSFAEPWHGFKDQLDAAIKETRVSHRPVRKLQGPLHEETLYGRPHVSAEGKNVIHIRVPVERLSAKDKENIVDPFVRKRVLAGDLTMPGGVQIKKVRIHAVAKTEPIGEGPSRRNVISGDNHHMEVVAIRKKNKTAYVGQVVSRLEAMRRHRAGEPVVCKASGDSEFLFSLSEGDMVLWRDELWRVRGITEQSNGRLLMSRATDARLKKDMEVGTDLMTNNVNAICSSGGRKVSVSPLGEIREAHD